MQETMLYTIGNRKIGKDTVIMNLTTATDCPAKDKCIIRNVCYALSAERLRPNVLAFRRRQEELWKKMPAEFFIESFKDIKTRKLSYIRFQESGDFATQYDFDKLSYIADALKGWYKCYTYTNMDNLDFDRRSKNLIVTGSNFMVDNQFIPLKSFLYDDIMKDNPNLIHCPGDCRQCTLCKVARNIEIYQRIH